MEDPDPNQTARAVQIFPPSRSLTMGGGASEPALRHGGAHLVHVPARAHVADVLPRLHQPAAATFHSRVGARAQSRSSRAGWWTSRTSTAACAFARRARGRARRGRGRSGRRRIDHRKKTATAADIWSTTTTTSARARASPILLSAAASRERAASARHPADCCICLSSSSRSGISASCSRLPAARRVDAAEVLPLRFDGRRGPAARRRDRARGPTPPQAHARPGRVQRGLNWCCTLWPPRTVFRELLISRRGARGATWPFLPPAPFPRPRERYGVGLSSRARRRGSGRLVPRESRGFAAR